jgi:hypothetical protein
MLYRRSILGPPSFQWNGIALEQCCSSIVWTCKDSNLGLFQRLIIEDEDC